MTSEPVALDLGDGSTFEHVSASDGEVVGPITVAEDGQFVPFDLLPRQVAPSRWSYPLPTSELVAERA